MVYGLWRECMYLVRMCVHGVWTMACGVQCLLHACPRCSLESILNLSTSYLYVCRFSRLGCRGHLQFMYSSVHADPYYALDSREDDDCTAFTTR
jgi:hypothetical protein